MRMNPTPDDVLQSTTLQVKSLIEKILKLEKEYQHYKNLSKVRDKDNELSERVVRLIEQEIKE